MQLPAHRQRGSRLLRSELCRRLMAELQRRVRRSLVDEIPDQLPSEHVGAFGAPLPFLR